MELQPFSDKERMETLRRELTDPRVYLYSCYDLGGVDGTDDWMFALNGYGAKHEFLGLSINRSPMGVIEPAAKIFFTVQVGETVHRTWDNLQFHAAYADRLEAGSYYWRDPKAGFSFELLMVKPGCARIQFTIHNHHTASMPVSVCAAFLQPDLTALTGSGELFIEVKAGQILFAPETEFSATAAAGGKAEFVAWLAAGNCDEKNRVAIDNARKTDMDEFRARQYELSHPRALTDFPTGDDREFALKVYNDLRANLINYGDSFFSAPNRVTHKGQWLWDTCFHVLPWSLFKPEIAETLIENLFQMQEESGFIPICYSHAVGSVNYATQPPLITFALSRIAASSGLQQRLYPKLEKFYFWLEQNRKLPGGLYGWKTGGESGMDNSPRFDDLPGEATTEKNLDYTGRVMPPQTAHIDLSCMMALFCEDMAEIAAQSGMTGEAELWLGRNAELKNKINSFLFDDESGFYFDREENGKWHKIKTVASFWALTAGVAEEKQARALVSHLMNPEEFFTPFPVPSVALDEKCFCYNYWRGPVWVNTCYAVVDGLRRYGFAEEANAISDRIIAGIKRDWEHSGHLWEIYDPLGGFAENMEKKRWGARENATQFAGWTATVLNLMMK